MKNIFLLTNMIFFSRQDYKMNCWKESNCVINVHITCAWAPFVFLPHHLMHKMSWDGTSGKFRAAWPGGGWVRTGSGLWAGS